MYDVHPYISKDSFKMMLKHFQVQLNLPYLGRVGPKGVCKIEISVT